MMVFCLYFEDAGPTSCCKMLKVGVRGGGGVESQEKVTIAGQPAPLLVPIYRIFQSICSRYLCSRGSDVSLSKIKSIKGQERGTPQVEMDTLGPTSFSLPRTTEEMVKYIVAGGGR